jgi:hypothetical protein
MVQGFLRQVNFYRRPLTDALKGGREEELVELTAEVKDAFKQANLALVNSTQLSYYFTAAYHPQSNGMIEGAHCQPRTLFAPVWQVWIGGLAQAPALGASWSQSCTN